MTDRAHFARINTRVTRKFKLRVQWACEQRELTTARRVPEGEILSELLQYLEPHPDEDKEPVSIKKPASPKKSKSA